MDDEAGLADVLAFIRREGKYQWVGGGMTVYPGYKPQQALTDACFELERRGLIQRHHETATSIVYVAAAPAPAR